MPSHKLDRVVDLIYLPKVLPVKCLLLVLCSIEFYCLSVLILKYQSQNLKSHTNCKHYLHSIFCTFDQMIEDLNYLQDLVKDMKKLKNKQPF